MAEMVSFASNGDTAQGYLALPATGSGPGVLVLQEWWGLVPQIKRVCDRLADEGFVALAPDLFRGDIACTGEDQFFAIQLDPPPPVPKGQKPLPPKVKLVPAQAPPPNATTKPAPAPPNATANRLGWPGRESLGRGEYGPI